MSFITAIGTATPQHRLRQSEIAAFMDAVMDLNALQRRKLRAVFSGTGIEFRHSVLPDYGRTSDFEFYSAGAVPSTAGRMAVFRTHALPLSLKAVGNLGVSDEVLRKTTHLITVTCTGLYAPGLDVELVRHLGLAPTVQRASISFMGCYAAINALRSAHAFCQAEPDARVLVVCTEICSIHFQHDGSDDNILANSLFSDGAAAVLVEREPRGPVSFSVQTFSSSLAPGGENDMAWHIGDQGFRMHLSAYVPDLVGSGLRAGIDPLFRQGECSLDQVRYFAVHPGGKKILEAVESALAVGRARNADAWNVLRDYGNMSSPTVLFVLHALRARLAGADDGAFVVAMAFGPGLTTESVLLQIHAGQN